MCRVNSVHDICDNYKHKGIGEYGVYGALPQGNPNSDITSTLTQRQISMLNFFYSNGL